MIKYQLSRANFNEAAQETHEDRVWPQSPIYGLYQQISNSTEII